MTRYPGLMPWHFGGDDCLTDTEADVLVKAMVDERTEASKQAAKKRAKKISGGRSRRRR